jgi:hypothetical protein
MFPTLVILAAVVASVALWLRGAAGRAAIELCRRRPRIFAPMATFLVCQEVLPHVLPGFVWTPLVQLAASVVSLGLSVGTVLVGAVRIACIVWLIVELARALDLPSPEPGAVARQAVAFFIAAWAILFGSLALVGAIGAGANVFVPALVLWGAGGLWLNIRAAPFVAAVLEGSAGWRPLLARMASLYRADPGRWRRAVAAHLLALGFVTFVWLEDYTLARNGSEITTTSAKNLTFHAEYVAGLPYESNWPGAVASSIRGRVPPGLSLALQLAMAGLTTVFMAAYAQARRGSAQPPPLATT